MLTHYINALKESKKNQSKTDNQAYVCNYYENDEIPLQLPVMTLQAHSEDKQTPLECGVAAMWYTDTALHVLSVFEDSDIYTDAKNNGDLTWTLGDVAEFFFRPAGRDEYFELHTASNNVKLELKFESLDFFKKGGFKLDDLKFDSKMNTEAKLFSKNGINGWSVHYEIPFSGLSMTKEELNGAYFSICRYNYTHGNDEPELSTTAPSYNPSFHNSEGWSVLKIEESDE